MNILNVLKEGLDPRRDLDRTGVLLEEMARLAVRAVRGPLAGALAGYSAAVASGADQNTTMPAAIIGGVAAGFIADFGQLNVRAALADRKAFAERETSSKE